MEALKKYQKILKIPKPEKKWKEPLLLNTIGESFVKVEIINIDLLTKSQKFLIGNLNMLRF
jgi:hypothetical protein